MNCEFKRSHKRHQVAFLFFLCMIVSCLGVDAFAKTSDSSIVIHKPNKEVPSLKNVLFLGDDVMFAYKPHLLKLIGTKANCTFISMPKDGDPD